MSGADKDNPMRTVVLDKVVVHMGVGESGQKLLNAEKIMETITGQRPIRCLAKRTLQTLEIKKNEPIGCMVTLRGDGAGSFLGTALEIHNNTLFESSFDGSGSFSFGLGEHTDFPGMSYDPNIGIYGMDVCVLLKRPGYRIRRRRVRRRKVPNSHRLTGDDAIGFIGDKYGVTFI